MQKENLRQLIILFSGIAVFLVLIGVFFFAVLPRTGQKTEEYLSYSLEGLDTVTEASVIYREEGGTSVPAAKLTGIALLPGGGFAVSGDDAIFLFNGERRLAGTIRLSGQAGAIAALPDPGAAGGFVIYAGLTDHINVYAANGEMIDEWTSLGEQASIVSLAAANDAVYAADSGNKWIARFDRGGRLVRFIGQSSLERSLFLVPGTCFDIALDREGRLWAVDPGRLRIVSLSAEGTVADSWGKASPLLEGFSGCCNPVNIALLPDGSFIAQEKGILRIKQYTAQGVFVGVVAGPESFHPSLWSLDLAAGADGKIYVVDTFLKKVRVFALKEGRDGVKP